MSDELVTIATFLQAPYAYIAKGLLEEEGIEGFIADENTARIYPMLTDCWVKLQVRESDAKRACEILDRKPQA